MDVLFGALAHWAWRLPYVRAGQIESSGTISFNAPMDGAMCTVELNRGAAIRNLKANVLATPGSFFKLSYA
jgi:hypothetical protein